MLGHGKGARRDGLTSSHGRGRTCDGLLLLTPSSARRVCTCPALRMGSFSFFSHAAAARFSVRVVRAEMCDAVWRVLPVDACAQTQTGSLNKKRPSSALCRGPFELQRVARTTKAESGEFRVLSAAASELDECMQAPWPLSALCCNRDLQ